MDIFGFIIAIVIVVAITVGPLIMTVYKKRVLTHVYDKSVVYLASEMSYAPEKWESIRAKIDYQNPKHIPIPFISTWRGMIGQPFTSFGQIGSIWYGLLFIAMLAMLGMSKTPFKFYVPDFIDFSFFLILCLCWFVYYFLCSRVLFTVIAGLMPGTWKAVFRIIADRKRFGFAKPSDQDLEDLGTRPKDYYQNGHDWYNRVADILGGHTADEKFLKDRFGIMSMCFSGNGTGSNACRVFFMRNQKLRDLGYTVQKMGVPNDGIILS